MDEPVPTATLSPGVEIMATDVTLLIALAIGWTVLQFALTVWVAHRKGLYPDSNPRMRWVGRFIYGRQLEIGVAGLCAFLYQLIVMLAMMRPGTAPDDVKVGLALVVGFGLFIFMVVFNIMSMAMDGRRRAKSRD